MSGSAELITNEVRRLVLTCRHLQAELEQSIPKKTHQEMVAKMQETLDSQSTELKKTKAELEKAVALSGALNSIEEYLSAQGKEITSQSETIKAFSAKISESAVPQKVYDEALAQNRELAEKMQREIETKKGELSSLEMKNHELLERMAQMVPRSEYLAIQSHLTDWIPRVKHEEEVQRLREQTVPKEQFDKVEARIAELQVQLENTVPKSEFERLMKEITSITSTALDSNEPKEKENQVQGEASSAATIPTPQPLAN